jgi:uncharacterized protein (TIGR03083 family)
LPRWLPYHGTDVLAASAAQSTSSVTSRSTIGGMILAPRYDGPTILSVDGHPQDQFQPFTRQRRRMQAMLAKMTDQEWLSASRCLGWTARDVVAHLVGVNTFWYSSIGAGLAGMPTRVLAGFDPAATPPVMVDWMSSLTTREVFDQFVSTTEGLLGMVAELTDRGWSTLAETPAGHVPIRLLAQHALWDSWIHERDIALPSVSQLPPNRTS